MEYQSLILFDEIGKTLIPINEGLFTLAQFLSEKKLNKKYVGNLVLFSNGELKEIKHVKINGYYGAKILTKIFSVFNSTYDIQVQLENSAVSFEEVHSKALAYLKNDLESGDPYMPRQDLNKLAVQNIKNFKQLYSAFNLPKPEDCLDVMV